MEPGEEKQLAAISKALKHSDPKTRLQAINHIRDQKINHPAILALLRDLEKTDQEGQVRLAATKALNPSSVASSRGPVPTTIEPFPSTSLNEVNTEQLLREQILLLQEMNGNLLRLEKSIRSRDAHQNVQISGVDMSIMSLANLMFKWFLAAIPVGIIIGFFLLLLSACGMAGLL